MLSAASSSERAGRHHAGSQPAAVAHPGAVIRPLRLCIASLGGLLALPWGTLQPPQKVSDSAEVPWLWAKYQLSHRTRRWD